jgi:hypothetical protein
MMQSTRGQDRSTYARISERLLKRPTVKPGRFLFIDDRGHVTVGHKSLHLTSTARTWRLFWRLKLNRIPARTIL